jgi:DNA-binding FrmR family transcriptional regulator
VSVHTDREKKKLQNRLRRMRGQLDAIERDLNEGATCAAILQQATACRGALDGFIGEVIEDHIREHFLGDAITPENRAEAAEELVEIVHSYLT